MLGAFHKWLENLRLILSFKAHLSTYGYLFWAIVSLVVMCFFLFMYVCRYLNFAFVFCNWDFIKPIGRGVCYVDVQYCYL